MTMTDEARTRRLERDVTLLKRYAVAVTLALALLAATAFTRDGDTAKFKVIDAERINIREADGTPRLVIANAARFPGPMKRGVESTRGNRTVKPAGMVFLSAEGSEMGGLALADTRQGKLGALLFDYDLANHTSEATGMYRRIRPDGQASAAWMINDPPAADADPKTINDTDRGRIKLQNPDRNAEVLLTDVQGNERIRLRVDKSGDARIEVLDAAGKVVFRAPERQ